MFNSPPKPDEPLTIVGISPWAQRTREMIRRAAPRSTNVLILGPTGTGKELIARALHFQSSRAAKPFIAVDCAVVNGPLFADHLFGHMRGAFTGADHESCGAFRAAEGGTILLDEVGELDDVCQAMLLRVLQQRCVTPVGGHHEIPVNVRVVAATNRDLAAQVAKGHFRADLFYRLSVLPMIATPLHTRCEDIVPLAEHLLKQIATIENEAPRDLAPAAIAELMAYAWPGNVRELRNVLERAVALAEGSTLAAGLLSDLPCDAEMFADASRHLDNITSVRLSVHHSPIVANEQVHKHAKYPLVPFCDSRAKDFSPATDLSRATGLAFPNDGNQNHVAEMAIMPARPETFRLPTCAESEKLQIVTAMQIANYNQSHAAAMLGVSRQQLRRRIEKHFPDSLPAKRGRPLGERSKRAKAA